MILAPLLLEDEEQKRPEKSSSSPALENEKISALEA